MNETGLTPFAWGFMLLSMGAVTILVVYCYWRILFDSGGGELSSEEQGEGAARPPPA